MADEYDFQINDLKFRSAISDKHPYQRATAPFRKEQFDSAPTVGDQSLTGWWTRGQLSFHKGEGVKYYEVLDGEVILNRFRTSEHVSPMIPGSVTLGREPLSSWAVGGDSVIAAAVDPTVGQISWIETSGGVESIKKANADGSGLATLTAASGSPNGTLTYGGGYWFAGTDGTNTVQRYGLGAPETVYTLGGSPLAGLWYGKGRLWAVDEGGYVYALPAEPSGALPVAKTTADAIFQVSGASLTPNAAWSFASGPGSVYIGYQNDVYAIALNTDGSVPTLSAGVVVLSLSPGEHIKSMRYLLGALIIGTDQGVRAALVEDGGALLCGPLIVRGECAGKQMGSFGSSVYALVDDVDDRPPGTRLVRINMETVVSDLVFAYDSTAVSYTSSPTRGVASSEEGVVVYGASGGASKMERWDSPQADLAATGELTTGQHRFGTLESKHFSLVRVRIAGDGGTVAAYAVDQFGNETYLTTLDAATDTAAEVTITSVPSESMGLRFELTRDALDPAIGPELLGYQIKAQPAPNRMRLLRWPLLITDTYRTRYGRERGTRGGAFTALAALEALESSDAVVTFTDHRTGETGSAYVEGIEFESNTPSSHNTTGFGGVAQLTLRVLD